MPLPIHHWSFLKSKMWFFLQQFFSNKTIYKFCYTKIVVKTVTKQQEWVHVYSGNRMISNKHIWFAFHKTTSFGILNFHRPWKYWLSICSLQIVILGMLPSGKGSQLFSYFSASYSHWPSSTHLCMVTMCVSQSMNSRIPRTITRKSQLELSPLRYLLVKYR